MAVEGPLNAAEIYDQITHGDGVETLSAGDRAVFALGKQLDEVANSVHSMHQQVLEGWQGDAGDAAADLTKPLAQASMDDVKHLAIARTGTAPQMDAFQTVKNSVKPVPAQPPQMTQQDIQDTVFGISPGYAMKVQGWQADAQQNIDAFSAYHSASTANGERMPAQYAQLADPSATVSMDQGTTGTQPPQPKVSGRTPGDTPPGTVTPPPGQQQPSTRPPGGQQPGQHDQPGQVTTPPATTNPSDSTHTSSYVPQPVNPVYLPGNSGYEFGPTGQPINALNTPGGGYGPFGPGFGTTGGFGPGTAPGSGEPGSGPGGKSLGPGAGTGRGATPNEGVPGRAGAAPAGAAGARGQSGMGMGAGAGKKKEEDKEHKAAPYLKEADPDDTFGGYDVKPMPPVIGETRPPRK